MNIQDATREALRNNKYIRRESTGNSRARIKPTNTYDCCLLIALGKDNQQGRNSEIKDKISNLYNQYSINI